MMAEPVGLSYLYPAIPIVNILAMLSLLLLVPGFWKTRVWALLALVAWTFLRSLLTVIGMIQWRGNIKDFPVWADLLAGLWYIAPCGYFAAVTCVSKFVWQRLQSSSKSARQIVDNRRRNNLIDAFITIGIPLLWLPTFVFTSSSRYFIIEDFGPSSSFRLSWAGFLLDVLPICSFSVAIVAFNVLSIISYRRQRRQGPTTDPARQNISARTKKLFFFSLQVLVLAMFAIGWTIGKFLQYYPVSTWRDPRSPQENVQYLKTALFMDRFWIDQPASANFREGMLAASIWTPLLGLNLFAWFGLGAEARKSYRDAFATVMRLLGYRSEAAEQGETKASSSHCARIFGKFKPMGNKKSILPTSTVAPPLTSAPEVFKSTLSPKPEMARRSSSESLGGYMYGEKEKEMVRPVSVTRRGSCEKPPLDMSPDASDAGADASEVASDAGADASEVASATQSNDLHVLSTQIPSPPLVPPPAPAHLATHLPH